MLKKILVPFCLIMLFLNFFPMGSEDENPEMEIYLLSNEIHTDIVLPVTNKIYDWNHFINPLDYKDRPSQWIEIGWGDRDFYFKVPTWNKLNFKIGFDALFTPDNGIIHVNFLRSHPENYASSRKIKISYDRYEKLIQILLERFKVIEGKPILIPGRGYSTTDNFYESFGNFTMLRTCNVWTAEVLGAVGLKHPIWSPTKYGLEFIYRKKD